MAEVGPSAQSVGREFVRQYYTMLNERPDCLHRFFSHNSSYVHGGVEKPGEEQPPVKGQSAIHEKIQSLGFKDCHAKIRHVDCQETIGNAVVIQVTGELSNDMGPMRRFMQTFILARQSPKMFYVHNDIFRYQDEVFHDFVDGSCADVTENHASPVAEEAVESREPSAIADVTSSVAPEPATVDHAPVGFANEMPSATGGHMDSEMTAVSGGDQQAAESGEAGDDAVSSTEVKEERPLDDGKETIDMSATRNQLPAQKPISWASLAGKSASTTANQSSTTAVVAKPQATIKPERKAESANVSQPLPQRLPRGGPRTDQSSGEVTGTVTTATDRKWTPADSGTAEGRAGPNVGIVPDSQQLFVGNLPHNVDDKELVDFFTRFGNVVDVKINRKGVTRDLPNFGFVSFDNADAVAKAISEKPLHLYGKHRINVEEKKEQSELFGRPRGGPRGGRGLGSYRGPYRGGSRGGHFSTHTHSDSDGQSSGFNRQR